MHLQERKKAAAPSLADPLPCMALLTASAMCSARAGSAGKAATRELEERVQALKKEVAKLGLVEPRHQELQVGHALQLHAQLFHPCCTSVLLRPCPSHAMPGMMNLLDTCRRRTQRAQLPL